MLQRILVLVLAWGSLAGVFAQADFRVVSVPPAPWPSVEIGQFFKVTVSTTGGFAAYGPWVVSTPVPDGMRFDPATGVLSGNPTKVANYKFGVGKTCCDGHGSSGILYDLKVVGPLTINTTSIPAVFAGAAYSFQFTASGGVPPYGWSIPPLSVPPFMSLDSATGVLSGSGSGNDDYTFAITVADKDQRRVTKIFTLQVRALRVRRYEGG